MNVFINGLQFATHYTGTICRNVGICGIHRSEFLKAILVAYPCVALPKSSNTFFSLEVLLANSLFQRCIDRIMSNLVSYWLHGHAPVIGTNLISPLQNESLNCHFIAVQRTSLRIFYYFQGIFFSRNIFDD